MTWCLDYLTGDEKAVEEIVKEAIENPLLAVTFNAAGKVIGKTAAKKVTKELT